MRKLNKDIVIRYLLFIVGLFISSLGVAFSAKSGLGTTPVTSLPYTVSIIYKIFTFGTWLNLLSLIQIILQVIILKGKVNPIEITIQTILAFTFGYMTNFSSYLVKDIIINSYTKQLSLSIFSCFISALGIFIQLRSNIGVLPGEALNKEISNLLNVKFGNVKIATDIFYILSAFILSFAFLGQFSGVKEGTIISAILVGNIIKVYDYCYKTLFQK